MMQTDDSFSFLAGLINEMLTNRTWPSELTFIEMTQISLIYNILFQKAKTFLRNIMHEYVIQDTKDISVVYNFS